MFEVNSTFPFILVFGVPGVFLIRYIFTGTVFSKYEDEHHTFKVWRNITITITMIVLLTGLILYFTEVLQFSLKWFVIIVFSIDILIQTYLSRKYMSHTNEFITSIVAGLYLLIVFYLFL